MADRSSGSRWPDRRRAPRQRCQLRRGEAGHKSVAAAPGREEQCEEASPGLCYPRPFPRAGLVPGRTGKGRGGAESGVRGCCPPRPPPGTPGPASPCRAAGLGVGHPAAILGSPQCSPGPRPWSRTCRWTAGGTAWPQGAALPVGTSRSGGVEGAAPGSRLGRNHRRRGRAAGRPRGWRGSWVQKGSLCCSFLRARHRGTRGDAGAGRGGVGGGVSAGGDGARTPWW